MSKVKTGLIALTAVMATILIIGVTSAYAQSIEEVEMCYGYSESTLSPQGTTSAFLTTNEEAGIWVKISNPPDDVTFKFYYEDNGVTKEYSSGYRRVDVVEMEGTNWGIAFATMDIDGKTPGFKPGVWTAKVWIDGEVVAEEEFSIVNYGAIASSISDIIDTVNDLVAEKNEVVANYENLVVDYAALEAEFESLQDTTVSQIQLNNLNREYEDLKDDYSDLQASQGSTRTMMYAAIVVALIAIIIAVYFGLMKK